MKRICLIKGQSQYDTTRTFIDDLARIYQAKGYSVHGVDMTRQDWPTQLAAAFEKPLSFAFSFNAVGLDVATDDGPIYDKMRTRFVTSLMDHPVYHHERLATPAQRVLVLCVDRTHAGYLSRAQPGVRTAAFLPHGGMESAATAADADRDLDIVFSGTYVAPENVRTRWSKWPKASQRVIEGTAELLLTEASLTVSDALETVLAREQLWVGASPSLEIARLARCADAWVRAQRRETCLDVLIRGGLRFTLFGDNWEAAPFAGAPSVCIRPAASYTATLDIMRRAKVVLNILPGFPDGSHDRIFCGMLNGAVVATDSNPYLREFLEDDVNAVLFPTRQPAALVDKLHTLLARRTTAAEIAARARATAVANHTWTHRAEAIESFVDIVESPDEW